MSLPDTTENRKNYQGSPRFAASLLKDDFAPNLCETILAMLITLLNTSILTDYGTFEFVAISLAEARKLVRENEIQSAIGHQSTAEILTELLGIKVKTNRFEYSQKTGESALVFKLRTRPPEGKILTGEEIEEIGYDFGILRRLK